MKAEDILQQLAPWREAHRRLAWKPIVADRDGEATASKFSGMPWLGEDEPYPCCQNCHAPMPLLLQLNLDHLPEELAGRFGSGLLQLFYCSDDTCDDYEAFADGKLVRVVQPSASSRSLAAADYPSLPPKTIVGWTSLYDYPSYQEHDELGLIYEYDMSSDQVDTVQIHCPLVGLENAVLPLDEDEYVPESEEIADPEPGDKLAGYPNWIQNMEYPNCPQCDRRMELVFQLDSDDHLPVMFGDVGCGHITQCPEHKEVVTFAWACS
ncbi:DUF1963 domain-containing protein [Pantanalinema sp. GBBB05]|uniref:DUF1963 domain-containing protein n=1 Tax=Pantanalinema sp. GBBB05 TaxID=2604139 RepID=UPI001DA55074|nr:DUF1963 domain-containing protein [Pantanalinema sp. GBBB05]